MDEEIEAQKSPVLCPKFTKQLSDGGQGVESKAASNHEATMILPW